ncbi:unnamed protein product [Didymodactylos carnosus]|uniref:RB1-inducible coiled-coil protein 1 n=1 Tax=Didymodactylos carnosus TaxID=1234261 RepID=A0A813WX05_9BILA|nr:unnamed protein product [Didymodactylos carnosus]CAF0861093.1 unnamed protein product [Didymodactylos carnosus]CAF3523572.1 unnamed protein product [Didymodactylos carnosus]CAF3648747.1 unnamed protein product [Didymodactylos carnosus]
MLYVFRVDIGDTYTFETDLAFKDVKTLKSTIEHNYGISKSKQILLISGGELLDDDVVQVCMKTCAGTEENPIYLLDKSHLERSQPLQIRWTTDIPTIDNQTLEHWLNMTPSYETVIERANTAQSFNNYANQIVQRCVRFVREQHQQYQGWMAVIANVEDTLSSFLLNRDSFLRLYKQYLIDRPSYEELLKSIPHTIDLLQKLSLPTKLIEQMRLDHLQSSTASHSNIQQTMTSTASSSSITSSVSETSTNSLPSPSHTHQQSFTTLLGGDGHGRQHQQVFLSLYEWITAQLANMKLPDIVNGCVSACTEELGNIINNDINILASKISSNDLKHMSGIEERFSFLQTEVEQAISYGREQKDCAEYMVNQRQTLSTNIRNQRDMTLVKDISRIHRENLMGIAKRHTKLIDIEKKISKSKQDIIKQLHLRFKNIMFLQRQLVDYDAKISLYIHKLQRLKKMTQFLKQLRQSPYIYFTFLFECLRRKEYSNIFNQFSQTLAKESKIVYNDELSRREQFLKQYDNHFLFNLFPGLKVIPSFFIKEPVHLLDTTIPNFSSQELERVFDAIPEIKENSTIAYANDSSIDLSNIIECIKLFTERESSPLITTSTNGTALITTIIPSTSSSNSRSMARSPSSSDLENDSTPIHTPITSKSVIDENTVITNNETCTCPTLSNNSKNTAEFVHDINKDDRSFEYNKTLDRQNNDTTADAENGSTVLSSKSEYTPEQLKSEEDEQQLIDESNNTLGDDYIQCSLDTVYCSTEMKNEDDVRIPSTTLNTNDSAVQTESLDIYSIQSLKQLKTLVHSLHTTHEQLKIDCDQDKSNYLDFIQKFRHLFDHTIVKFIQNIQEKVDKQEELNEQLKQELLTQTTDNETLKIQYDVCDQSKVELKEKYDQLQIDYDEYKKQSDNETHQIVRALNSDFEFELERIRTEHELTKTELTFQNEKYDKLINEMNSEQTRENVIQTSIQTDTIEVNDKETMVEIKSKIFDNIETQTVQIMNDDKELQTSFTEQQNKVQDEHKQSIVPLPSTSMKEQQIQFNQAIQRAVQNATIQKTNQINELENNLEEKRLKIRKLKECIRKLKNFYTFSTSQTNLHTNLTPMVGSPPSAVAGLSSTPTDASDGEDDESANDDNLFDRNVRAKRTTIITAKERLISIDENDGRQTEEEMDENLDEQGDKLRHAFMSRSEPINMPSTFIQQSVMSSGLAVQTSSPSSASDLQRKSSPTFAGLTTSLAVTPTSSTTVTNFIESFASSLKTSPVEYQGTYELYTPFAASPGTSLPPTGTTPNTTSLYGINIAAESCLKEKFSKVLESTSSVTLASPSVPTAPSLISFYTVNRSDKVIVYYEQKYQQYIIYTLLPTLHFVHSDCYELLQINKIVPQIQEAAAATTTTEDTDTLVNSSITLTSTLAPSCQPILGQVTDKEYCQAKKINNRFNVPLGTKFYRVRVKPWKPGQQNIKMDS